MCAAAGNPCGELKYQDAATGLLRAPRSVPNGVVIVVVVVELKNWAWAAAAAAWEGMDSVQGRRIVLPLFPGWPLLPEGGCGCGDWGITGLAPLPPMGPYLPFTANSKGTNSSGSAKIESDLQSELNHLLQKLECIQL